MTPTFKTFEEIVDAMPFHLRKMTLDLKGLRERPDYHPEASAYEHVRIVTERILSLPESYQYKWTLVAAAVFHDLGKRITAKPNEKLVEKLGKAYPTSPGHDKFGAEMAVLESDWIFDTFGVHHGPVSYICKEHMRISSFPNMRTSKQKAYMEDTYFSELCTFHMADDMLLENFSQENMYDLYKESKLLLENKSQNA